MVRDRRTMISMMLVPLVVFRWSYSPVNGFYDSRGEIAGGSQVSGDLVRITTPSIREALEAAGFRLQSGPTSGRRREKIGGGGCGGNSGTAG